MSRISTCLSRSLTLSLLVSPGLAQTTQYVLTGDESGDSFGWSAAAAGDVDGDGRTDWIVGAPGADPSGDESGSVRVHSGPDGAPIHTFVGASAGDFFGFAVDGLGDVDNDGRSDLVVGAPLNDAAGSDAGAAYVYSGLDGSLRFTFVGEQADDEFGYAVAGVGDTNLDGVPDIAVGAPGSDVSDDEAGRVYVFSGADGALLFTVDGNDKDARLGASLAGPGDVDQDGRGDVLAGAPTANEGTVVVLSGNGGSMLRVLEGVEDDEQFGYSVAGAGDVDGDTYVDLLVGAPFSDAGRAVLFSGLTGDPLFEVFGPTSGVTFGRSVAGPGDVDGDGVRDFVIGLDEDDTLGANAGAVRVFSGADGGLLSEVLGAGGSYMGASVAGGDVVGDARVEFCGGARRGAENHGTFTVFGLDADDCPTPEVYCVGAPNSVGPGASMCNSGTVSIAANDFVLGANGAPPGQFGVFFYGPGQIQVPFGNGFRCVASSGVGLFRLNPPMAIAATGEVTRAVDYTNPPELAGQIAAGSTWNFQFWYRDPAGGGAFFNLSDALSATFCP